MRIETLERDSQHGLDSYRSKVVLGFICWIMFTSTLCLRAMGVVYIGIVDHFNVSREEASWPGTVAISALGLAGPLYGLLSELLPYHVVLVGCTMLTSFGIILCYFAPSVSFITFFFGVVHGASLSGVYLLTSGLCSQYFKRWHSTANGIAWSCQCISAFFIPDVANFILIELGALDIFLITGAMTLNAFPAALYLKSPPWVITNKFKSAVVQKQLPLQDRTETHKSMLSSHEREQEVFKKHETLESMQNAISYSERGLERLCPQSTLSELTETYVKPSNADSVVMEVLKVFCTLCFLFDALSYAVYFYTMTTYFLVHVDLARDRSVLTGQAIYLQHIYSLGDFLMRLSLGFILDRGHFTVQGAMALGFLGNAVAFEALAWSQSMASLLPSALLLGLSQGILAPLPGPLLKDEFGNSSLTIMMGGMFAFIGLLMMSRPPVVGYFKDHMGKYDGLLHVFSATSGILCLIWLGKTIIKRRHLSTKTRNDHTHVITNVELKISE